MRVLMGLASVFENFNYKAIFSLRNEILTRISNVPIFTVAIEIDLDYCNVLPQARLRLRSLITTCLTP